VAGTAGDYFDAIAAEYDSRAARGIPRYRDLLETLASYLPPSASQVAELGCGTGALTVLLLERFPRAHVTAVDAASRMIDLARRRVGVAADNVSWVVSEFESLELPQAAYDLVTGSMSLHHLADKAPLYAAVRRSLRTTGLFVFADELTGAFEHLERLHWDAWEGFARAPGHLSDAEMTDMLRHVREHDRYETLARQLELLREAGFAAADCAWRYLNYAVFVALA
jgi:tRNA (cmo5U34)-methyltransferase